MKTNEVTVDRWGATIYMEDGQIWHYNYWTDGHKDSLTHKVITAEEARHYAESVIKDMEKERRNAESSIRFCKRLIERCKGYCT
jgi:sulfite reductase beta subunit-like hemoprotein